jgi:membrane protease YdiL (CAAX protease family)
MPLQREMTRGDQASIAQEGAFSMIQMQHSWLRRHRVAVFLIGSVALGWLATLAVAGLPSGAALLPLLAIPVSYAPAAVAFLVLRIAGTPEERVALRARIRRVRAGWPIYGLAAVGLPLVYFAAVGIATLFGGSFPFQPALLLLLPVFLVTNIGEEIGWRGYAVPALQRTHSPLATALIVGVAWSAFHWLALLANADAPLAYAAIGSVVLVAFSVILTALFNAAGQSVALVAVAHATYDTVAIGVSPLAETGVPLLAFALIAVVAGVVVVGLVAMTGSSLRFSRPPVLAADVRTTP